MASDDTVERTQKMVKHEKPMSNLAGASINELFRGKCRKRYSSKIYANMSGHAHLEMYCTNRMQDLEYLTCFSLNRKNSPTLRRMSLRAGTIIA